MSEIPEDIQTYAEWCVRGLLFTNEAKRRLVSIIATARATERERCAKIADVEAETNCGAGGAVAGFIASAIRAHRHSPSVEMERESS